MEFSLLLEKWFKNIGKTLTSKYSQKLLGNATKSTTNTFKTVS